MALTTVSELEQLREAFRLAGFGVAVMDHASLLVASTTDCGWWQFPREARIGLRVDGGDDILLFDGQGNSVGVVNTGPEPRVTLVD
jgi:hypothetical protein